MKIPDKAIIRFEYNDEYREYIFDRKELRDVIKELQARIDKAIEYIEHYLEEDKINCGNIYHSVYDELLDILKEDDKE